MDQDLINREVRIWRELILAEDRAGDRFRDDALQIALAMARASRAAARAEQYTKVARHNAMAREEEAQQINAGMSLMERERMVEELFVVLKYFEGMLGAVMHRGSTGAVRVPPPATLEDRPRLAAWLAAMGLPWTNEEYKRTNDKEG